MVEWVSTCNYWAARQSKEPLQGGIGNLEYGWGSCLDDVILDLDAVESGEKLTGKYIHDPDAVNLSHWIPPAPTMVSSILDEKAQFESLQTYVDQLNEEINEHREIKRKIVVKVRKYECRYHFLVKLIYLLVFSFNKKDKTIQEHLPIGNRNQNTCCMKSSNIRITVILWKKVYKAERLKKKIQQQEN